MRLQIETWWMTRPMKKRRKNIRHPNSSKKKKKLLTSMRLTVKVQMVLNASRPKRSFLMGRNPYNNNKKNGLTTRSSSKLRMMKRWQGSCRTSSSRSTRG